jgi:DNA invertase Pin-like site-specific DNA recombinase
MGSRKQRGYGQLSLNGRRIMAHRLALEMHLGTPLPIGVFVCHRCDNPPCCNPAHLFLGDNRDNSKDALKKGRLPHFTRRGAKTVLSSTDVAVIQASYRKASGGMQGVNGWPGGPRWATETAQQYGVSQRTIYRAIRACQPRTRSVRGPGTKLSQERASDIRRRAETGASFQELGRIFGLHRKTVARHIRRAKAAGRLA